MRRTRNAVYTSVSGVQIPPSPLMYSKQLSRTDFDYWVTLATRWGDLDAMQHINHATYLTFMETARLEYYEYLGFESRNWDHKEGTILGSMTVYYHHQVLHPTQLDIGQRISRVGNKSFDILTGIFVADQDISALTAIFTIVSFNYKKNATVPVPDKIRDKCREL